MTKLDHNCGCGGKIYRDQSCIFIVAPCWCGQRYDEPLYWLFRLEHSSKLSSWHSSADTSWHNCATETMTRNPANAAAALPGSVLSSMHARKHVDAANDAASQLMVPGACLDRHTYAAMQHTFSKTWHRKWGSLSCLMHARFGHMLAFKKEVKGHRVESSGCTQLYWL